MNQEGRHVPSKVKSENPKTPAEKSGRGNQCGKLCKNRITPLTPIDPVKVCGGCAFVVGNNGESQLTVNLQPLLEGLSRVILAAYQRGTTTGASLPLGDAMKGGTVGCPTFQAGNPFQNALADHLIGKLKQDHEIQGSIDGGKCRVEMLCLTDGPRKSVKEKARAIGLHPGRHDTDDEFIGDEQPLARPRIGFTPKGGTALTLGTQKGPRGDMGNPE
jgi:hypothetical protein